MAVQWHQAGNLVIACSLCEDMPAIEYQMDQDHVHTLWQATTFGHRMVTIVPILAERENEGSSLLLDTLHTDIAAIGFDKAFADDQPKCGALFTTGSQPALSIEPEELFRSVVVDTYSIVRDAEGCKSGFAGIRFPYLDFSSLKAVFDGIGQ